MNVTPVLLPIPEESVVLPSAFHKPTRPLVGTVCARNAVAAVNELRPIKTQSAWVISLFVFMVWVKLLCGRSGWTGIALPVLTRLKFACGGVW